MPAGNARVEPDARNPVHGNIEETIELRYRCRFYDKPVQPVCCARTFKPPRSREISMHTAGRYSAINPESGRRRVILIALPFVPLCEYVPRTMLGQNNNSSAVERLEHVASTSLCVLTDATRRSIVPFLPRTLYVDMLRNGFHGRKRNVKMETSASLLVPVPVPI